MRYLVLVYEDLEAWTARPCSEWEALEAACRENDAALRQSGYLVAAEFLAQDRAATTIRVSSAMVSLAEGVAERALGRLHAVLTLEARDLNAAIQVVATMPQARLGPVEVCALRA